MDVQPQSIALATSERLVQALASADCYDHPVAGVEVIETHISWVLLTGEFAYKIKKPLKLPFADFSTLELRRELCEEEVRLNRRLAPDLYLGVVPIGGTYSHPRVDREAAIEYAVKMRQFPSSERLDRVLERNEIDKASIRALGETIALFHAGLEADRASPSLGGAKSILSAALENFDELDSLLGNRSSLLESVARWTRTECERLALVFAARKRDGHVVEGHGDLHTENVVRRGEALVPFDALEFNAELRWTDTMAELGFFAMDLCARGRTDLGYEFLDRALEVSGDYDGLRVLRFYMVYRAVVRLKVAAIAGDQHGGAAIEESHPHLAFARAGVLTSVPALVITHGLSGSGKSTVAAALVGRLPAIRIRSDVERKRLHGLEANATSDSALGGGLYSPSSSRDTYGVLERAADAALDAGFSVVVDAAFLGREERAAFRAIAEHRWARFVILHCMAPDDVLRERVETRAATGSDPSEATLAVLEHQMGSFHTLTPDEQRSAVVVDTSEAFDIDAVAAEVRGPTAPGA
ncbi:MAG: AAA family ATPase [Planctomycetota bacterium]